MWVAVLDSCCHQTKFLKISFEGGGDSVISVMKFVYTTEFHKYGSPLYIHMSPGSWESAYSLGGAEGRGI